MKAITLHQPWATWVAKGWKTIETRTHARFKCLEGRWIAIHAAKFVDGLEMMTNRYQPKMSLNDEINLIRRIKDCRGTVVCTALVGRAHWFAGDAYGYWAQQAMTNVDGKFLLFLKNIRPLPHPVPFRGRQGIFDVPDDLLWDCEMPK